jgi:hypothetical protein
MELCTTGAWPSTFGMAARKERFRDRLRPGIADKHCSTEEDRQTLRAAAWTLMRSAGAARSAHRQLLLFSPSGPAEGSS